MIRAGWSRSSRCTSDSRRTSWTGPRRRGPGKLGCVDCKTNLADRTVEHYRPFRGGREPELASPGGRRHGPRRRRRRGPARRRGDRGGSSICDEPADMTEEARPWRPRPASLSASIVGPFRVLADRCSTRRCDVCDVCPSHVSPAASSPRSKLSAGAWKKQRFLSPVVRDARAEGSACLMPRHQVRTKKDLRRLSRPALCAQPRARSHPTGGRGCSPRGWAQAHFPTSRRHGGFSAHLYPDVLERVSVEDLARPRGRPAPTTAPARTLARHPDPVHGGRRDAQCEAAAQTRKAAAFRELVADCEDRIHVVECVPRPARALP